jgi:hypothetical protein
VPGGGEGPGGNLLVKCCSVASAGCSSPALMSRLDRSAPPDVQSSLDRRDTLTPLTLSNTSRVELGADVSVGPSELRHGAVFSSRRGRWRKDDQIDFW